MSDVEGQPRGYKMLTTPTSLSSPSSLIHIDQIHLGLPLLRLSQRSSRQLVTDAGMCVGSRLEPNVRETNLRSGRAYRHTGPWGMLQTVVYDMESRSTPCQIP